NLKSLLRLWKFCFSVRPQITAVSLLTPLPGSGVYRDMLAQNRIISLNWRSYSCQVFVVRHPYLDTAVLNFFYPLIQFVVFMTTSFFGLAMLAVSLISFII